jgi:hypothetical protein
VGQVVGQLRSQMEGRVVHPMLDQVVGQRRHVGHHLRRQVAGLWVVGRGAHLTEKTQGQVAYWAVSWV